MKKAAADILKSNIFIEQVYFSPICMRTDLVDKQKMSMTLQMLAFLNSLLGYFGPICKRNYQVV